MAVSFHVALFNWVFPENLLGNSTVGGTDLWAMRATEFPLLLDPKQKGMRTVAAHDNWELAESWK